MDKKVFIGILLFVLHTVDARFYTLDQLIDNALKKSIDLQLTKKQIEYTDLQIQEIFSNSFPSISLSLNARHLIGSSISYSLLHENELYRNGIGDVTRSVSVSPMGISDGVASLSRDQNLLKGHSDLTDILPENSFISSIVVLQPIFLQGKTYLQLKIARSVQAMAVCTYEATKNSIIAETTKKYYTLLIEQQRGIMRKERISLLEEHYRLSKINYSFAHANDIDTLESLLLLEQAYLEATYTESERNKAAEALIVLSCIIESPSTLRIDDQLPEPVFFITAEEAVARLYETNNQIKQFKGAENIQEKKIRLAKSAYLPEVYIGGALSNIGQVSTISLPLKMQWGDDRRIFAGITWQFFTGFSTQRTVQQQINLREQLLLSQQRTIDQLELKTRMLHADIMVIKERLAILKRMIDLSEKQFFASRIAYENGCGTAYAQKKAELEVQTSKLTYNEQLYLFHIAVIDLKQLIGCLLSY